MTSRGGPGRGFPARKLEEFAKSNGVVIGVIVRPGELKN
jgi:hypothetical protein